MSAGAPPSIPRSEPSRRFGARLWIYRVIAAVFLPGLLLFGLEVGLRLAGSGRDTGFMIPDETPGFYRTNPDFVSLFMPTGFDLRPLNFRVALHKPAGTVRIVVLGESAAQGVPAPAFGFAPQLRAQLRARYPGRNIEVLNTGIVAINSHVVHRIAHDLARFSPDLFVVYLGNNEVVGPYGPGCAYLSAMPPLWVIRFSLFVRATRTGQLLGALLEKMGRSDRPPAEWGGMSMFVDQAVTGDDPRLRKVYRNFEANLRDIIRVARGADAKILLCTVVANLKDCPPLLSRHRPGLTPAELAAWQRAYDQGRLAWRLDDTAVARAALDEARRIDPQYAEVLFMLGTLELGAGDTARGRALLADALHQDALRFRPDARINEIIRDTAAQADAGVQLLDAARFLGADPAADTPPAGREWLFEHVHLDWTGNQALARAMAEGAEQLLTGPVPGAPAWLEAEACAAAVGHTPQVRHYVLERMGTITTHPPFTNQLTYPEDMARYARELAEARAASADPRLRQAARATIAAAVARDPDNADLAKLEGDIADDLGDVAAALTAARRAARLQPYSFSLPTDQAIKLARLGRYAEAEQLLRTTAARAGLRDQVTMAPAFVDLFIRTKRLDEGRRHLAALLARRPGEASLQLQRGRLERLAGDAAAAEQTYRSLLAARPADTRALEALVALLTEAGRSTAVAEATFAAAAHQPGNQANNLRAALLSEQRGAAADEVRFLLAAERSGPVNSALELRLARKLAGGGRPLDALWHLAGALRLSRHEGDPAMTESIAELIAQLRAPAT